MRTFSTVLFLTLIVLNQSFAQNAAVPLQAEDANLGADFSTLMDGDITYVTPSTDFNNAAFPGIAEKVMTFDIAFPSAGAYDLYARVRVGPDNANDDSFYIASGFGAKVADVAEDWIRVNGTGGTGEANPTAYITEEGVAGTQVWKWINISECSCTEGAADFSVTADALTQTFQMGSRENAFDIDMIAFGNADLYYTGTNLMNAEDGVAELPDPGKTDPIATGKNKFLGSAYSNAQSGRFDWHWNQVTPENGGKWGSVEGTQDVMNWGALDAAYNEARDNDFVFKHHVLFWGAQQPTWMAGLSEEDQLVHIHEWLAALAERYPDLEMIEVVNEPLHDPPFAGGGNTGTQDYGGYGNALGGAGDSGWDWILEGFRLARQYFPNAQLMLNDYGILNSTTNINDYLAIVDLLLEEELIDMLGVQGHAFTVNDMSASGITSALNALATRNIPLYITELDVDGPGPNGEAIQLRRYQEIFPPMWEHEAVAGITVWGFNPGHWREDQGANLVRSDGSAKPAFTWMRAYVEDNFVATTEIVVTASTNNLDVGTTLQMTADVSPDELTLPGIIWSVDNGTGTAEIDADGLLTAISSGEVEVIATSVDGSNASGYMSITINALLNVSAEMGSLVLYPNPVNQGRLKFKNDQVIQKITMLDLNGKVIREVGDLNSDYFEMALQVNPGIYIIQLHDPSGLHTRRVVVN